MKQTVFFILALLLFGVTQGVEAQKHVSKLKTRTVDAEKWIINPNPAEKGQTVNVTYAGRKKVMSVQAEKNPYTDLSMVDNAGNERQSQWTANCYMVHTAGKYRLPLVYGNAIKNGEANTSAYTGTTYYKCTQTFPNHEGNAINAPWITKSTDGEGADRGMGISVASAELLWQDAKGLVTEVGIKGDYLTLTVGKNAAEQEGNAVVAAKTADGTIVWSWHIWVTRQTFAAADLTTINTGSWTYKLTPVNVGWVGNRVSAGYSPYYQWGRKDAFIPAGEDRASNGGCGGGGSIGMNMDAALSYSSNREVYNISGNTLTGITIITDNSATIADNIKHPTTFYYNNTKPNSFDLAAPHNQPFINLWDSKQNPGRSSGSTATNIATATTKTVYDPCPAGFCVPTSNLWNYIYNNRSGCTLDETNVGMNYTSNTPELFFPLMGRRVNCAVDPIENHGKTVYFWSATGTFDSSFSLYGSEILAIKSDRKDTFTTAQTFFGYPIRAVAE